jgi:hypothetical protein
LAAVVRPFTKVEQPPQRQRLWKVRPRPVRRSIHVVRKDENNRNNH